MKKYMLMLLLGCCALPVWAGEGGTTGLLFAPSAEVSDLEAVVKSGETRTTIRWSTSFETGVNAFRVTRTGQDGSTVDVGLVRARGFEEGYTYEVSDPSVQLGDQAGYDLFFISNYGEQQLGSWEGVVEEAPPEVPEPVAMATEATTAESSVPVSERKCWIGNVDRVKVWTNSTPADRIRFSLTEEGVYKATAQEIADAGGWDYGAVTNALTSTNFTMSCQGEDVAWLPDEEGMLFVGYAPESRWAPENVYWIEFGPGLNMAHIDGTPPENGTTNQWFMDDLFVQGTGYALRFKRSTLADEPVSFLSFSPGFFLSGDSRDYDFTLPGCAGSNWAGEVTVNLMSTYEIGTDNHTGRVSAGTAFLGESVWSGEQYVSVGYPFSSTNVDGGVITLNIENIAHISIFEPTDYSKFLFISAEFCYPRLYQSEGGALLCTGGTGDTVSVSGFATNDIFVLDVTATNTPEMIKSADLLFDGVSSNWSAVFACGDTSSVYQVCSKPDGIRLPSVRGVKDVDWTVLSNAIDYVILIPPEGWAAGFRSSLQSLADYREDQGLNTQVVDVESLYNTFSYGLVDPEAIHDFCVSGVSNWISQPLRYLLLAGDGTYDFKHDRYSVDDETACLIPSLIDGQSFNINDYAIVVPLDPAYGDVNGDGKPEIGVGRIPTTDTNEISTVVAKTREYEQTMLRGDASLAKQYVAVAPDWNDVPGSDHYYAFDLAVDRVIDPLESAGRIHVACRADPAAPNDLYSVKTNSLLPALQSGAGIFHFLGHSNPYYLGHSGYYNGEPGSRLFGYNDISPGNWEFPTVAIFVGCNPNIWQYIGISHLLVPDGLFAENTGFAAGLGATGYLLSDEGEELGVHLYSVATEYDVLRLGDLHRLAMKRAIENPLNPMRLPYPERDQFINRLHCFNLMGDPALVIRHDITAMGTDVEWLVEYGQTNANADVLDVDGDGWATWREYLDDTDPTNYLLQFTAVQVDPSSGEPQLSFETSASQTYQVLYTPELSESNEWQVVDWAFTDSPIWNPATSNIVPDGPVTTVAVPAITNQGFYSIQEN